MIYYGKRRVLKSYMILYKITNKINGMIYIGITTKSLNQRWKAHLNWAKFAKPYKLHEALNVFGAENFIIEQVDTTEDYEKLKTLEKQYIKNINCKYPNGYNLTSGGQGVLGIKFSDETRKKLSDAAKRRGNSAMITTEAIKKSSVARTGKKRTKMQKQLMSKNRKGKAPLNDSARKHPKEKVLLAMNLIKNNIKQFEIAALTGLTQSYISNLKTGKRGKALIGV